MNTCSHSRLFFFLPFSPGILSFSHLQFSLLHLFTFCRLALSLTSASVFSHSLLISPASLFFYYLSLLLSCSAISLSRFRSPCSTSFTSFFSSLAISCCSSLSFFSVCSHPPPHILHPHFIAKCYLSVFLVYSYLSLHLSHLLLALLSHPFQIFLGTSMS